MGAAGPQTLVPSGLDNVEGCGHKPPPPHGSGGDGSQPPRAAGKDLQQRGQRWGGLFGGQTLQPLDLLIVQTNTNVLSSHFVSLACLLWLARMIDLLDPLLLEEDNND